MVFQGEVKYNSFRSCLDIYRKSPPSIEGVPEVQYNRYRIKILYYGAYNTWSQPTSPSMAVRSLQIAGAQETVPPGTLLNEREKN
jgi:hypothetical protein